MLLKKLTKQCHFLVLFSLLLLLFCCCVKLLDDARGLLVLNLLKISGSDVCSESFLTSSISVAVVVVGDVSINGLFREELLLLILLHNDNCVFFDDKFSSLMLLFIRDSQGSTSCVIVSCGVGLKL